MVSHFTNVKVKGVTDEKGNKNYIITNTDDGVEHVALKRETGSKYDIGEHTCLTLRQCKQLVSEDRVRHFADRCTKVVPDTSGDEVMRGKETWSCVDPCALVIMLAAGVDVPDSVVDRTLDAWGWIIPAGLRDIVQAEENYDKWSK